MSNTARRYFYLPLLFGGGILVNAVIASVLSNLSTGVWMTYLLGLLLIAMGILSHRLPHWIVPVFAGLICIAAIAIGSLFVFGNADTVTYTEDAVIVLGAGIQGDKPTENLRNRLERAVRYHTRNPHALIVVSGGQGPQETVTEATAMARYLTERGIPSSLILKEEAATGTDENFRFSKDLLDKQFDGDYTVAFITTDYHIYRASLNAGRFGFETATHCHSHTPWYMIVPNGLRECLAVGKALFTKTPSSGGVSL